MKNITVVGAGTMGNRIVHAIEEMESVFNKTQLLASNRSLPPVSFKKKFVFFFSCCTYQEKGIKETYELYIQSEQSVVNKLTEFSSFVSNRLNEYLSAVILHWQKKICWKSKAYFKGKKYSFSTYKTAFEGIFIPGAMLVRPKICVNSDIVLQLLTKQIKKLYRKVRALYLKIFHFNNFIFSFIPDFTTKHEYIDLTTTIKKAEKCTLVHFSNLTVRSRKTFFINGKNKFNSTSRQSLKAA